MRWPSGASPARGWWDHFTRDATRGDVMHSASVAQRVMTGRAGPGGRSGNDINSLDRSNCKVPPWAPVHGGARAAPYPYPLGYIPSGSDEVVDRHPTKNPPGTGPAPPSLTRLLRRPGSVKGRAGGPLCAARFTRIVRCCSAGPGPEPRRCFGRVAAGGPRFPVFARDAAGCRLARMWGIRRGHDREDVTEGM
jgi:hypothetical protein